MKLSTLIAIVGLTFLPATGRSQPISLTQAQQRAIIDKTIEYVVANYVYPERAEAVATALRKQLESGRYDAFSKADEFLNALNSDMQSAGHDRHLRVIYSPQMAAQLKQQAAGDDNVSPEFLEMLEKHNYQLKKAESLDGNVGYLKFDNFVELQFVKDALVGAMNFLHSSSALIVDLSDNGGGASDTAEFLMSYFLPAGTRTSESWDRTTGQNTVTTVAPAPEVKQLLNIPLYVLVSERTASAAEAVAYTLQQAKRAVIVGTQTKGLANAGRHFPIDDQLFVMVPTIVSRNLTSGTNWEGVGVTPDVAATPGASIDTAMESALKALAGMESDDKERYRLLFIARPYSARISSPLPRAGFMESCIGAYEDGQTIVMRDGSLHYVKGSTDRRLSFVGDDTFAVEGRDDYQLRFPLEAGRISRLYVLWYDDTSDTYARTN